jgi:glycosyltransferase involved in cell wall biosynthesis
MSGTDTKLPDTDAAAPLVLIIGGSLDHLGGVEAFCDRSARALAVQGRWRTERLSAGTAYLSLRTLPAFVRQVAALVARGRRRIDVVWVQYVNLPDLIYVLIARLMGRRVMVTPHLGVNWRSQHNPLLRRISRMTLRLAHRLALISRTQEGEIALPVGVPRSHIRNFLPPEVLEGPLVDTARLPERIQLIHSARLSEGKGTFMVVEVCDALRARGVAFDARITGTGDSETMRRLHDMVARLRLEDQVQVLGRIPETDLLEHLRRSDVLVHLSKIDSYPLIVLEATACGAVPVVMELAGARDMVESFVGEVVSVDNPVREVADWIASQDLRSLRATRHEAAEAVRLEYGWARCAEALVAALDATRTDG